MATYWSKILPWVLISHTIHFVHMESCWGVPSPNPANIKTGSIMILVMCFPFCYAVLLDRPVGASLFSAKRKNTGTHWFRYLHLVETRGVEPLSEGTSSRTSPGAVILLKFPLLYAK